MSRIAKKFAPTEGVERAKFLKIIFFAKKSFLKI
jgi:hypothetical protein